MRTRRTLAKTFGIPARPGFVDIMKKYLVPQKLRKIMGDKLFVYHGY